MSAARADEYTEFCLAVHRLCRIDLLQYKRGQMERRIRTFVERRQVRRLADYADLLKADAAEREAFLDRITINVSQLWRNPEQWQVLHRAVLPELARHGRIRAWSAGSSYGAEAFTLAAVAAEALPGHPVTIRGTDIDRRMVDRARTAEFSQADVRDAPPALLKKWFVATDSGWRAKDELRRVVRFEQGDLLRMRVAPASLDLVLCRNTVIYFNDEVRDALHARLAASLRPGGCLVVGATERVVDPGALGLTSTHPFTYRKS
jgi:chemotaxis protein methyltransferase CheR